MIDEGGFTCPLHLSTPILINGEKVSDLSFDADNLTVDLYCEATNRAAGKLSMRVMETDYNMHFWIGCALIIADNQPITFDDLGNGLKGQDIIKVVSMGRFFMTHSESSEDESSEEPSDGTPESSPHQSAI